MAAGGGGGGGGCNKTFVAWRTVFMRGRCAEVNDTTRALSEG